MKGGASSSDYGDDDQLAAMERAPTTAGHHVHDIHIADRARVQFGDQYYSGGLTISRSDVLSNL